MASVIYNELYRYDNVHQLLMVDEHICCAPRDNGPMNKNPIKVHAGIDNEIIFRVLDPSRNAVDVSSYATVIGRIIDQGTRQIILEKVCITGPAKGIVKMIIDAGDFQNLQYGRYELALIYRKRYATNSVGYNLDKPMYSDLDNNIVSTLLVTDQANVAPVNEIVYTK